MLRFLVAAGATTACGVPLSESFGVQAGRVCPACGQERSIPLIWGLPDREGMLLAERDLVALGGCLVGPDEPALVCRACGLEWGRDGVDLDAGETSDACLTRP